MSNEEKFGGNLEGIRQKLSYLEKLGITGIYLNPIMEAESNHKYDTTDYTKIDPSFGNGDTMKVLCKEAHEKGFESWWMPYSTTVEENLLHGWMY